jgi:phosphonate transport system substrate-binding protein
MISKIPNSVRLVFLSFIIMISCNNREKSVIGIDFSDETTEMSVSSGRDSIPALRVAIAAVISPKESFVYYRELFDYMSDKLNMKIEFKQRMSYEEVNGLLDRNLVDIAFICSGAYVDGSDGFDLLVVPLSGNQPYYFAYVITHENSGIETFEDIRGRSFAFTDPLSFTGKSYALKRVADFGGEPDAFFKSLIYTTSHDISIQMVSRNLVDAASIDGLIFDYLKVYQPEKVSNVRIIEKSENFGIPPVVSALLLDPEIKVRIRELFTDMHRDERGQEILDKLLVDRFMVVGDSLYNSVRKIREQVWQ